MSSALHSVCLKAELIHSILNYLIELYILSPRPNKKNVVFVNKNRLKLMITLKRPKLQMSYNT